jgi:hypothetical protein
MALIQCVNSNLGFQFEKIDEKMVECLEQIFESYNSIGTVSINMGNASLLNQTRKSNLSKSEKQKLRNSSSLPPTMPANFNSPKNLSSG